MTNRNADRPLACAALLFIVCAGQLLAAAAHAAERSVDLHKAADPEGQVEIIDVAGHIEIVGWDQPEIAVSGTIGDRVDRVDLSTNGDHATVRVVLPALSLSGGSGAASLVVHVPQKSLVRGSLVSANLETRELLGEQRLRTVSGDIKAHLLRGGSVNSVSGDLHLTVGGTEGVEIETISGDVSVDGAGSNVRVQTVSGELKIQLGTFAAVRLKTISGEVQFGGSLGAGGRFEAESVSGEIGIRFAATPAADFDIESHTGEIANCFGPAPQKPQYGPGSHLVFRSGDGSGRVRVSTLSGEIRLCDHP
jgi:DUF4097 and DUF4098 domain-containing protein YvlB